jgi:hypothetical protein
MKLFVIRRQSDSFFWTGSFDLFTNDIREARVLTEIETEVMFIFRGEEWFPLPQTQPTPLGDN